MSGLGFSLRAVTETDAKLRLVIDKQRDGSVSITLIGDTNCGDLQIDFESISKHEAHDLAQYLLYRNGQKCSFED